MRRIWPTMPHEVAQRIIWEEGGDVKARLILNQIASELYAHQGASTKAACATLIHAEAYLRDREEYTREPWPKNMVKLPVMPRCEHSPLTKKGNC